MSSVDRLLSRLLPHALAASIVRRLLKSMGIGHGGIAAKSGEIDAMQAALDIAGRRSRDLVVFDVGANVGDWSVPVAARFPGCVIHAFEPSAAHLERLRPALRAAGLADRVTVNAVALGREAGAARLYKDQDVTGLASMTRRDLDHVGIRMDTVEEIEVRTLDGYCRDNGVSAIDFLKIDVEGHELDVLAGAAGMLESRAIGAIQFEFGGCNIDTRTYLRDFFRLLEGHGYSMWLAGPSGRLSRIGRYREFYEQFATTNYVAIRAAGPDA